jgi:5-methylcytosine-specific restriction endonuclease McrA
LPAAASRRSSDRIAAIAKLKSLTPRIVSVTSRVNVLTRQERERGRDRQRDAGQPWRQWYKTARWQRLRWSVLVRDAFTCRICDQVEADTSQLVADHRLPHHGGPVLFWDEANLQCLCKICHDGEKRRLERSGKRASYRPEWLRPSSVPLTIVCGAPASGKSTYVARRMGVRDMVIDLDVIASQLSGQPLHGWSREEWLQAALFRRNAMLGRLSRKPDCGHAWFVLSEPDAVRRQWWAEKMRPAEIVVLETPEAVCVEYAARDGDRDLQAVAIAVKRWWRAYRPRSGDTVIRTAGGECLA